MNRRLIYLMTLVSGAIVLAGIALWWPQALAEAQCGSQASSCKNCHEVQGKKPVNNDGNSWHQSHAFGDFCANCHAGNVQATDETTAHLGMVAPLSDIKANCAACHPNDTQTRAVKYATLLGVQIGGNDASSGGTTSGNGGTGTTGNATPAAAATATTAAPAPTTAPSSGNQGAGLVDYNQQYSQTTTSPSPLNWGNLIAGFIIVLLAAGGGTFVVFNERRLRAASRLATATITAPTAPKSLAAKAPSPVTSGTTPPGWDDLLAQLQKLDPLALRALRRLTVDPVAGSELLVSLSRIDPRLIDAVRHLDRREINLLMALAEEH